MRDDPDLESQLPGLLTSEGLSEEIDCPLDVGDFQDDDNIGILGYPYFPWIYDPETYKEYKLHEEALFDIYQCK